MQTLRTGRHALAAGAIVGVAHFALAAVALRALLAGQAGTHGPSVWAVAAVAVLGFPLFYTPFRPTLGGAVPAGWVIAALNALLWGAAAGALVLLLRRRQS